MGNRKLSLPALLLASGLLVNCGGSPTDVDDIVIDDGETTIDTDDSNVETGAITINEIVASAADGGNDWFEIYVSEGSVDLSSYTVVDDDPEHQAQSLPAISLSAGEYLVIEAIDEDDVASATGYYVTFKLGGDDALSLMNDGVQVDILDWDEGDAETGFSFGRYLDGTSTTQTLSPSPGAANIETSEIVSESDIPDDTFINENAELRINEIVAKATDGGDDWIEFYVTGEQTLNLSDYTLADEDGVLSPLPSVSLAPGDFYQVFANGSEESDSVTFKLGSNDLVSLYKGDDLIDQLKWDKGDALIGMSYGRLNDGSDQVNTLSPTALSQNSLAQNNALLINEVVANDVDGGADWFELYNASSASVSLNNYQVIDSSDDIDPITLPDISLEPGQTYVLYASDTLSGDNVVPFKLGNEDELSLLLDDETVDYIDWNASDVIAGYSYGLIASNTINTYWDHALLTPSPGETNSKASAFDPTTVSNLYITITDSNWQDILNNPLDEEYHETAISFNGIDLDSVAIRTKGGSSLSSVARSTSDRYSFKIDINKYVDGQKFFNLKKFTLQNSFNDPSYMREVIAYDLLTEIGLAAPEHAYVNVYVNDELFGLYLMVEAIDSEFIERHFANTEGDLYKPDGTGSDLVFIDSSIDSYSDINLQNNEDSSDQGAFINLVESLATGSEDAIDADSVLRYMSVSVALSNMDSYHGALAHNYYIYEQDGKFSFLPWDFNESFGTFNMDCNGVDIRELYIDEPTNTSLSERPLIGNVFNNQDHLDTYHGYLQQLIDGPLSSSEFSAKVYEIADVIREHVANDPSSFYGLSAFESNLDSTYSRFYGLTSFMEYRVSNMNQQLAGTAPSSSGDNSGFCGTSTNGPR